MTAKPETAAEVLADVRNSADTHERNGSMPFPAELRSIADRLERALSAQGEAVASPLDLSAPPKVWLQIDSNGDAEDRSEAIPREAWGDLTWCYESIGGQEVVYIRADLAHPAPARVISPEICIVCDWSGDTARFVEAEVGGKSVAFPWRDRSDGLKELVVSTAPARVTEEMVERACVAYFDDEAWAHGSEKIKAKARRKMHVSLTAALEDGRHG